MGMRETAVELLTDHEPMSFDDLLAELGCSKGRIRELCKEGSLHKREDGRIEVGEAKVKFSEPKAKGVYSGPTGPTWEPTDHICPGTTYKEDTCAGGVVMANHNGWLFRCSECGRGMRFVEPK